MTSADENQKHVDQDKRSTINKTTSGGMSQSNKVDELKLKTTEENSGIMDERRGRKEEKMTTMTMGRRSDSGSGSRDSARG